MWMVYWYLGKIGYLVSVFEIEILIGGSEYFLGYSYIIY